MSLCVCVGGGAGAGDGGGGREGKGCTTFYGKRQMFITTLKCPTADAGRGVWQFTGDNMIFYLLLMLMSKQILKTNEVK